MPKITFLPNEDICPDGATIDVDKGTSICRAALDSGISIEHACELSCACTTCHVFVVKGLESLADATDDEAPKNIVSPTGNVACKNITLVRPGTNSVVLDS